MNEKDIVTVSIYFRPGRLADALCISGLATQVFLDTYANEGMRADIAEEALTVYAPAQFEARLSHPGTQFVVAECNGHLLGFAEIARHADTSNLLSESMELVRLYVQRHAQGQGIGRVLLNHAETLTRESGLPFLWLTAWVENHRALRFYTAQGYEAVGVTHYAFGGNAYENRIFRKISLMQAVESTS
ncbi:GNAT family N-acetyltransferase [Pseudomonas sp. DR48]|uniref:GNAT family N-acetyltransferase n=1 Tax=Pseudomonas sp. DR48 TaxID=2871095 RepID=UPI001C9A22F8|nr:GNAT family N-acetyltransferase [Pseudomonas sp. DR48]QZP30267.1 GNAT family N-acetyltransferase [Pseudomonas sp. DR48]